MSSWPISIRYDGKPQGKGRPRFGKGNTYTPEKTRSYETDLKWLAKAAMKGREVLTGAVRVSVVASFKSKELLSPHTKKPDLDNIVKMLDAFNGIVWVDDSQISILFASKVNGFTDFLEVMVRPLGSSDVPA